MVFTKLIHNDERVDDDEHGAADSDVEESAEDPECRFNGGGAVIDDVDGTVGDDVDVDESVSWGADAESED